MESKWINIKFLSDSPTAKTKIYEVTTKDDSQILGYIKWFGRWRKYAFYPESNTLYEQDCLRDIANYIDDLMEKRKK